MAKKPADILIVDDEADIRTMIQGILEDEGYTLRQAGNSKHAYEKISERVPDLIIQDIWLQYSEHDGLKILETVKGQHPLLPVIMISGHGTIETAVTAIRHGAYDFIEKPVVPDQLTAIVERALEYRRLKDENIRYQNHLEEMVREKSAALREALTQVKSSYDFTLEAMASLLDARERSTARHCSRVRDLSVIMARELGLSINEIDEIARGALLHDIGKMSIPDSILLKPGPLTPEEREEMKRHPEAGYQLLSPSPHLKKVAEIIRSHHERYDGTGYPRGLKGTDIPLGARIFAIIDSYDAMRSDRIYRKAVSKEEAMREIERHAGTQFDPALVEAFKRLHLAIEAAGNWDTLESA